MAKSDFKCEYCGVKSIGFLRISSFRKYTCPKCKTICEDCVKSSFWDGASCKHCGSKVIVYEWTGKNWTQI